MVKTQKKLRVLIYAHLFGPVPSGMTLSNLEIAKGLRDIGHTIEVIACKNGKVGNYDSILDFRVHLLPKWQFSPMSSIHGKGLLNWFFMPYYWILIKRRIQAFKPDVIFIADETSNCFWGVWANKIKVPYISYCSVPYLNKWYNYTLRREIKISHYIRRFLRKSMLSSYKLSNQILAVSRSTKTELIQGCSDIDNKIHILPRSIDNLYFNSPVNPLETKKIRAEFNLEESDFVILSATRLEINKGIDDVMKALSSIDKKNRKTIKYIIAGGGNAFEYLSEVCSTLKLTANTIFTGPIPHKELIPYYDVCDVYVLPSRRGSSESFGRVFVEAAARSKPSIAVKGGGMQDIIEDGKTGFLVSAGDYPSIQNHIMNLFANRSLGSIMGRAARRNAINKYTTQSISLQLSKYLFSAYRQK